LDERGVNLSDSVPLLGQPPRELITASQIPSDAVPSITLPTQFTGKIIEVRTQWATAKPVDGRCPRKIGFDHEPLLLFHDEVEKEKHYTA
jgi:hypothetical protein